MELIGEWIADRTWILPIPFHSTRTTPKILIPSEKEFYVGKVKRKLTPKFHRFDLGGLSLKSWDPLAALRV